MAKKKNSLWIIMTIILVIANLALVGYIIKTISTEKSEQIASENKTNTNSNELIIGNSNAKITIIEYSDFECPFCERFYTGSYKQIKSEYIDTGKVKLVFKHFPLTNIHPNAVNAAIAVECANEQNKWSQMHDKIFDGSKFDIVTLKLYAIELELDSNKFDLCLDSQKYKDKVMANQQEGITAGVSGTPTLFINGKKIVGAQPFSVFKQAIDEELAKN